MKQSTVDARPDQLDLNLLRLFDALRTEGSVSGAARRLRLTQSGASRALARLRDALGDPLFLPANGGLLLTPYAERVADHVRCALEMLTASIARAEFDPCRSERRFVVAMTDYSEAVLLLALCRRLEVEAPGVRVEMVQASHAPPRGLGDGALDLSIAVHAPGAGRLVSRKLLRDELVAAARIDHPVFLRHASLRDDCDALQHVVVASDALSFAPLAVPPGGRTWRGARRLQSQSLLASALLVAQTDWIAILPRLLAAELERRTMLRILPVRLEHAAFDLRLHWHERFRADDGHRWLRGVIRDVAAQIPLHTPA